MQDMWPPNQKAWEKLPDETDKAWQAFLVYLDLTPPRTYQQAADKMGRGVDMLRTWGRKYHWVARSLAYDNSLMQIATLEEKKEAIAGLQQGILVDERLDYERMRDTWVNMWDALFADGTPSVRELKQLVEAREKLAQMIRRTARMPLTYQPEPEETPLDDKQYYLDVQKGPVEMVNDEQSSTT